MALEMGKNPGNVRYYCPYTVWLFDTKTCTIPLLAGVSSLSMGLSLTTLIEKVSASTTAIVNDSCIRLETIDIALSAWRR